MSDRETVIAALENCAAEEKCRDCPWDECECEHETVDSVPRSLLLNALELLKAQEPRVMTLDELTNVYVEFRGDCTPIRLSNFDVQKIIMYVDDGICRLWTGKPTDEQRKAVKWYAQTD